MSALSLPLASRADTRDSASGCLLLGRVNPEASHDRPGRHVRSNHTAVGRNVRGSVLRADDSRNGHVAVIIAEFCERHVHRDGIGVDLVANQMLERLGRRSEPPEGECSGSISVEEVDREIDTLLCAPAEELDTGAIPVVVFSSKSMSIAP